MSEITTDIPSFEQIEKLKKDLDKILQKQITKSQITRHLEICLKKLNYLQDYIKVSNV